MKLLLVEDHAPLREIMTAHLLHRGFAVTAVECGADALSALRAGAYDAVVLDLGLPDMDGIEVLRRSRGAGPAGSGAAGSAAGTPTLILTARDAVAERVRGLDAGADDYILKPFELAEFDARLRAVLRRPGSRAAADRQFGDLSFDQTTRMAWVGAAELDLTRREGSVFEALVRARGRMVVKDALEDQLYGGGEEGSGNAVEAAVSRVRRKLALAGSGVRIETARGLGYRLREDAGGEATGTAGGGQAGNGQADR